MSENDVTTERPDESGVPPAGAPEDAAAEPAAETVAGGTEAEAAADGESAGGPAPGAGPAVDFRDRWLRAEADLQNFRRRAQRDVDESRRLAEDRLLLEVLEVLDDLERGIETARESGAGEAWLQGIELVAARVRETLARAGVAAMDPVGQPFDPRMHEAMLEMEAPDGFSAGEVAIVLRKGYRRGERALRAARVGVARAPDG